MSRYAILIPVARRTSDQRVIRWYECELHDGERVLRDPLRPFFSADAARTWAETQGYEIQP